MPLENHPIAQASDAERVRYFLEAYLNVAPIPLAIVRSEECALFSQVDLEPPVLDIGCGDGLFASVVFPHKIDVGLDLSWNEIQLARPKDAYKQFVVANGDQIPFPDNTFSTVISNCVFEHIPNFYEAFQEIHRVLKPGGRYIFTAHSNYYDEYLFFPDVFRNLGLNLLRQVYLDAINSLFRHYNCYTNEKWTGFLKDAGFASVDTRYYLPRANMRRFDILLPFSFLAVVNKKFFGKWIHLPKGWLSPLIALVAQPDASLTAQSGGALFFVATKSLVTSTEQKA